MTLLYYVIIATFLIYAIYFIYKNEKGREDQLNLHLLEAKGLLTSNDLKDKRNWFINRFKEAENNLVNAQSAPVKKFDFKSLSDLRNTLMDNQDSFKN